MATLHARIIVDDRHREREATVEIDTDHPQSTVAELAARLGLGTGAGLVVDDLAVEPSSHLSDIGLAEGSTISTVDQSNRPISRQDRTDLVAIGGLSTGRRFPLRAGVNAIGPGRAVPIRLDGVGDHSAIVLLPERATHVTCSGARSLENGQPTTIGDHLVRLTGPTPPAARPVRGSTIPVLPKPQPDETPLTPVGPSAPTPAAPTAPTLSWVAMLAPLAMGAVIAVLWSPRFALFAAFGPVLAIGTWLEQRRRFTKQQRDHDEAVARGLALEADQRRDEQRRAADSERSRHPDHAALTDLARQGGRRLWSGSGPIRLSLGWRDDRPHRIDAEGRAIGLIGDPAQTAAVIGHGLLQLAIDRPPSRLGVGLSEADDTDALDWLRWLPHHSASVDAAHSVTVFRPGNPSPRPPSDREVHVLLVADDADLPPWTDVIVEPAEPGHALVHDRTAGRQTGPADSGESIMLSPAHPRQAERIARMLARWREVDPTRPPAGAASGLADLVGPLADDHHRRNRWQAGDLRSLATPIGSTPGGVLSLDLVRDGPHAVIGGTTGSGKSELLRTLVASMCAEHPPDLLHLVLVDYKGGSAFDGCRDLPHVATVVTDLDGHRTRRVLAGIEAELARRERWLRSEGVGDLREAGPVSGRPARLVVVIDEFATMLQEHPDQLAVLIDVARRGRSLGLHLVLATQRPAGAMTDDIRANVDLRIALRMVDPADSVDVIGVGDAARLPTEPPGQALLRRPGSALESCQVALATAPWTCAAPLTVRWADDVRDDDGSGGRSTTDASGPTQLEVLVASCDRVCAASERSRATPLWPDDLPADLDPADAPPPESARHITLGLIDDLREPVAVPLGWPTEGGLLALHGGPRAALPTVLGGMVTALVAGHDTAHVYVVASDPAFTSWSAADAVGAVALSSDRAALGRVLDRLDQRGRVDSNRRASAHLIVVVHDLPAIARDLDDLHGLRLVDRIHGLLLDRSGGMSAVVTTARPGALPTAVAGAVDRTLIGHVAQADDYRLAGLRPPSAPLGTGRVLDESGREVQLVTVEPTDLARRLVLPVVRRPPPLDELPALVTLADVEAVPDEPADPGRWLLPVGRSVEGTATLELPLGQVGLVAGPPGSGRTATLRALQAAAAARGMAVLLLDGRGQDRVDGNGHDVALGAVAETCGADAPTEPTLLLIDNAGDLPDHEDLLRRLCRGQTRPDHLRVVVALDPLERRTGYSHWTGAIGRCRNGIALHHDLDDGRELWLAALPPPSDSERPPGRGLLVTGSASVEIQVFRVES